MNSARWLAAVFLAAAIIVFARGDARAASCCGGGAASPLVIPKFAAAVAAASLDLETYDGYWNGAGAHVADPPGSALSQARLSVGYARRLGENWQAGLLAPVVMNDNRYANESSSSQGIGDVTANVWYEAFDNITCVYQVESWRDLVPAVYLGGGLVIPTGVSPFDGAASSYDITGRGFYRLDAALLVEKTVFPWSMGFSYSYGIHRERPVNREYGAYVAPYTKRLGDRRSWSLSGGYTHYAPGMGDLTATVAYSDLAESAATIDGAAVPSSGVARRAVGVTLAWTSLDSAWVARFGFNRAPRLDGWGENFPSTDIYSLGVSHVFW